MILDKIIFFYFFKKILNYQIKKDLEPKENKQVKKFKFFKKK
ncbi:hypothetical protein PRV_00755 [Mycoplasma parvum str. Indiana]|uniref:Uncharacterized protein n=1 Tax=Mycoplasma parvum str. Indiana TaxID=1403316 RepID=U5NBZ3_9MOLU|nr:hypothetical protein PRV_00755 [Mycoplasma parvum str. Indiana]